MTTWLDRALLNGPFHFSEEGDKTFHRSGRCVGQSALLRGTSFPSDYSGWPSQEKVCSFGNSTFLLFVHDKQTHKDQLFWRIFFFFMTRFWVFSHFKGSPVLKSTYMGSQISYPKASWCGNVETWETISLRPKYLLFLFCGHSKEV